MPARADPTCGLILRWAGRLLQPVEVALIREPIADRGRELMVLIVATKKAVTLLDLCWYSATIQGLLRLFFTAGDSSWPRRQSLFCGAIVPG